MLCESIMSQLKKVYFVLVFLWHYPAYGENLELVMGKENPVCDYMFKLYKKDISQYGHLNVSVHKEHQNIGWKIIDNKEVNQKYKSGHKCAYYEQAKVDINNDKKDDFVIRNTACMSDVKSNNLYIYNLDDVENTAKNDLSSITPKYELKLWGNSYKLNKLPKIQLRGQFQDLEVAPSIAGTILIEPFIYGSNVYMSLFGTPRSFIENKWVVISELDHDFNIHDICYFKKY